MATIPKEIDCRRSRRSSPVGVFTTYRLYTCTIIAVMISVMVTENRDNWKIFVASPYSSGINRIWGTKRAIDSETPKAPSPRPRPLVPIQPRGTRKISTEITSILLRYCQFQNLIYHFPELITYRAIHLSSNRFIFQYLCFIVALPRNAICHISVHLASKFNSGIYKILQLLGDTVRRAMSGCFPLDSTPLGTSVVRTTNHMT